MKRRTNVVKLGLSALALIALVAVTGCGAQNPMAPNTADGPSSSQLEYEIGSSDGGGSIGGGTGTVSGTGGQNNPRPGRRRGWERHGKP